MLLSEHPLQLSTSLSLLGDFGGALSDSSDDQSTLTFRCLSVATNGKDFCLRQSTSCGENESASELRKARICAGGMQRLTIALIRSTVNTPSLNRLPISSIPTRSILKLLQHPQNNLPPVLTVCNGNHLQHSILSNKFDGLAKHRVERRRAGRSGR